MSTVALQLLATEWGIDADTLANQLGNKVITDDLEIRHVARADAAQLLAARHAEAKARAETEAARREQLAAMQRPVLARVAALQAQQHALRANGAIDASTPALVAMTMGDTNDRLEAKGRLFDELFNAGRAGHYGTLYKFNPHHQEA